MPRGGRRPRAGRPKGKKDFVISPAERERRREIEAVLPEAFKGDAYDLLVSVYKDPSYPLETRLAAAAKAIVYEQHPLSPKKAEETDLTKRIKNHRMEELDLEQPAIVFWTHHPGEITRFDRLEDAVHSIMLTRRPSCSLSPG
jgi:hypothetical protein